MAEIAVMSFDRFLYGDKDDRLAVAGEVYNAFSTVGWLYLKDHSIPQSAVDEIFASVIFSFLTRLPFTIRTF
jgi:isopenicillin N synthase-like dioxygenase